MINVNKCKCVVFDKSRDGSHISEIILGDHTLESVDNYRYLGHIIERDLRDKKDVEFRTNQFYSRFNSNYRKFKNVTIDTFMYLFNAYCLPDYGLALWNVKNLLGCKTFRVFEVAYHGALKKILGISTMYSNHDTAEYC